MINDSGNNDDEKFVQNGEELERGLAPIYRPVRRIKRKKVPAHIEQYLANGRVYYRYRRGTDKPIHLGSADAILKAVKIISEKTEIF